GEQCDDGNTVTTDACTATCQNAMCGDGSVWQGHEQCDDTNKVSGDGCSSSCKWEPVALTGYLHSCVLAGGGAVKCWGTNFNGELGLGDTRSRGINPGEMGAQLPAIPFGSGRTVRSISAGNSFTCVLLDDSSVK